MGKCLTPILMVLGSLGCWARMDSISFAYQDQSNGLVNDRILCILEDRYGLMWFGTQRGLVRFDGMSSVIYAHDPTNPFSISNNNINTLFEDSYGNLWVGTSAGLNLVHRELGVFIRYHHDPEDGNSISSDNVWSIAEEAPDRLWVGTERGLNLFHDNRFQSFGSDQGLSDPMVTALARDSRGFMWVGTNTGGLFRTRDQKLEAVKLERNIAIERLHVDHCGDLWVGTRKHGLLRRSATGDETWFQKTEVGEGGLIGNTVTSLDSDYRGFLWVGTSQGLSRYDLENGIFKTFQHQDDQNGSLRSSSIGTLYCSPDGILWAATNFGGVDRLDLYNDHFSNYSVNDREIRTISQVIGEQNRLWVGTKYGGLALLSLVTGESEWFLSDRIVRSIYQESTSRLWVGTDTGLVLFNPLHPEAPPTTYFQDEKRIWRILPDPKGFLWLGTGSGLIQLDPQTGSHQLFEAQAGSNRHLNNNIVTALVHGEEDLLWIGTYGGGLNQLDPKTGFFRHYTHEFTGEAGLIANDITHISRGSGGRLWIATHSGGLNLFDPETERFQTFSTTTGFLDNITVASLEEPSGRVWVSTSIGLVLLDPETGTCRLFDTQNGVRWGSAVPGACLMDDQSDRLFFAGTDSVVIFNREQIHPLRPAPILFTRFLKRGVEARALVHPGETLVLDREDRSFSLELAMLDYRANHLRRFAWQRMNVDDDWYITADERTVNYTRYLSYGGTAELRVKATGSGTVWSETSITLKMDPPWWIEWSLLLILLGLSLMTSLVYLLVSARERVRRRKLKEQAQIAEQKRRLAEERASIAEKSRIMEEEERRREEEHGRILREHLEQVSTEIANDLHDGPLGELHGLGYLLQDLAPELKESGKQAEFERISEEILPEICGALRNVCGQLLLPDFRAGLLTELDSYADVIENFYSDLSVERHLEGDDEGLSPETCAAFYRIFRTTLKNVGKHAQANKVVINFSRSLDFSELTVEDNGRGFLVPPSWDNFKDQKHYGMYMANYLAMSVGGSFAVDSAPGHGTQIRVRIPAREDEWNQSG